jgi:DNA-binding Lrp family transcriptional regulator
LLQFTKEVSLAIDLVNHLTNKPVKISEAAEELGVSHYTLQGVVRKLAAAGVINSSKGKGGGVSRKEGDLKLKTLLMAFYGTTKCTNKQKKASEKINHLYISFLEVVSVYEEGNALSEMKEPEPNLDSVETTTKNPEVAEETEETEEDLDFSGGW